MILCRRERDDRDRCACVTEFRGKGHRGPVGTVVSTRRVPHLPSFATCAVSRETFRLAVALCITPFCAARIISGSAARSAAKALAASPAAMASSTLRTKVRIRERRALLTCVRRAILRVAFLADVVLAIRVPSRLFRWRSRQQNRRGRKPKAPLCARAYSQQRNGRQRIRAVARTSANHRSAA